MGSFMPYTKGMTESEVGNIGWTAELETGLDVLDEQHRRYSVCRYATGGLFKGQKLASVDNMDAPLESGVGVHNYFVEVSRGFKQKRPTPLVLSK